MTNMLSVKALLNFFLILFISSCMLVGQSTIDSLQTLLKKDLPDSVRISASIKISNELFDKANYNEGFQYIEEAISLSIEHKQLNTLADAYYSKAYGYDLKGDLAEALNAYDLSSKTYLRDNNITSAADAMNGKGVAAYYQGDYEKALVHYLEALKFAEENNLKKNIANLLNNIGVSYRLQKKNDEAIEIYLKAIRINRELKDDRGLAQQYNNLGVAYTYKKELKSALVYLDSAMMMYTKLDDKHEIAFTHSSYGNAYLETNEDLKNARHHLLKANGMLKEFNMVDDLAKNYGYLVQLETSAENINRAIQYANEGLALTENTDRENLKLGFYEQLQELYHKQGNDNAAYKNLKAFVNQSKEIQDTEKLKAIEELQTKYATEQKEQQIKIQELELAQLNITKKNYAIIIGLGSLALLMSIWFISNKIKTNKQLQSQKEVIQVALEEKNILLREIHHRVKNNLQVISSLLGLQSKYTDDPNIEEAIKQGKNRVHSMTLIHQNLYQADNLTGVDIQSYFSKLFKSLFKSYNLSGDRIQMHVDVMDLQLDVDSIVPIGLVVNELVTNSLKHAFPDENSGNIWVSIYEQEKDLVIKVADDGIGLPADLDTSDNGSFGFELIDAFKHKLKADMEVQNENGTTILLRIKNYHKVAA